MSVPPPLEAGAAAGSSSPKRRALRRKRDTVLPSRILLRSSGLRSGRKKREPRQGLIKVNSQQRLLAAEAVFYSTDCVLHLTLELVGLAFRFRFAVARHL